MLFKSGRENLFKKKKGIELQISKIANLQIKNNHGPQNDSQNKNWKDLWKFHGVLCYGWLQWVKV